MDKFRPFSFVVEELTENPRPTVNYRVERVGKEKTFVECEPVMPGLAEDFSVVNNALYGRESQLQQRTSIDVVDLHEKLEVNA